MIFRSMAAAGLALVCATAAPLAPARAQAPTLQPGAPPPARTGAEAEQFARDLEVISRANRVNSYVEVEAMRAELEAVLSHAPKSFRLIESTPGRMIVREDDPTARAAAMVFQGMLETKSTLPVAVSFEPNVYGLAALYLGSLAVERKDYAAAEAFLTKGSMFQPDNPKLISERGHALAMQKRFPEALAAYRSWEVDNLLLAASMRADTARIQRGIGFVLIEEERYDEAEAVFNRSLELDPGNRTALGELDYIRRMRAGAPKGVGVSVPVGALNAQEEGR